METRSLGFIGGGRVTRILLQLFENRSSQFSKITVADTYPDVSANLKKSFQEILMDKVIRIRFNCSYSKDIK